MLEYPSEERQFIVFVNTPAQSVKTRAQISEILYKIGVKKYVVLLNGDCYPEEKYYAMSRFCDVDSHESIAGCVFTTGVGSMGIDSAKVHNVIYATLPESMSDLYQGMGCASRRPLSIESHDDVDIGLDVNGLLFVVS